MKRIAVFPGSFDPLTNGHVDIINRTLEHFDEVVVAVLANPAKRPLFSTEERKRLVAEQFGDHNEKIRIESFSGLLVDFVRQCGTTIIVRGLRAISDFDYEAQMALVNKKLDEGIETFFLMAREANSYVSSTLVKQIAPLGGDVSEMVPPVVAVALKEMFPVEKKK